MGWLLKLFGANPLSMLWIGGGVFLAGMALGTTGAWTVQGWRLDAAKAKLESMEIQRDDALADAKKCSESVKSLKSESDKRARNAVQALAKAREGNATLIDQIARRDRILAAAKGQPKGDCPSGAALAEIRGQK